MKQDNRGRQLCESMFLALLLLLLVPVELLCAKAAFETLGEIDSVLYWMLTIGGNCLVILVAIRSRAAAATLALLVGLAIIPYQAVLMQRFSHVQAEAAGIVAYAYEAKARTGEYPANLDQYTYSRPETKKLIQGYHTGPAHGGFQLIYRVGTVSTSHWYSPKDGWSYYPD